jgi:hypothetical protein
MKTRVPSRILCLLLVTLLLGLVIALPVAAELPKLPDGLPSGEEIEDAWNTVQSIFAIRGLEDVVAMFEGQTTVFLLILAAASVALALWGYRLSRALFVGGGFAGGCMLGAAIYDPLVSTGVFGTDLPEYTRYIAYAVFGVIVALLVLRIIKTGIFLAAAVSTYFFLCSFPLFEMLVDAVFADEFDYKYLIARLLVAAVVGGLALALTKPVMIVMTSAAGGMLGAPTLAVALGFGTNITLVTVIGVVLIVLGMVSQFRQGKRR